MAIGTTAALLGGAALSAGASIIGSNKAAGAAAKGADAQAQAAAMATQLQRDIYDETSGRLAGYTQTGDTAMQQYLYEMGLAQAPATGNKGQTLEAVQNERGGWDVVGPEGHKFGTWLKRSGAQGFLNDRKSTYETSPMAKYLLNEGVDDITASMEQRGMRNSGAALKAIEDYRQNVILQDRDNYMQRLAGLMDSGQNAAAQQGSAGQAYATNAGNAMMQGGNAQAAGYNAQAQGVIGTTNAITGGIGDFAGIMGYMNPQMNPMASMAYGQAPAVPSFPRPSATSMAQGGLY